MFNDYKHLEYKPWDESKIQKCCPESKTPPSTDPPGPDCGYNKWQAELNVVNKKLTEVSNELTHEQKHLALITVRYNRLKLWNDELTTAGDLAEKVSQQLEIIESQLTNICINTTQTIKGVEILFCMVRDFYYTLDYLQEKYDSLLNCIKCLNNPGLVLTSGIGKVLTDYGTVLATALSTRDALIQLVMSAIDASISLHRQICDEYGYQKLISIWRETLNGGIADKNRMSPDPFRFEPILHFPILDKPYFLSIHELYEQEKKEVKEKTHAVKELLKRQLSLQAIKQSLISALKEVTPAPTTA